MNIYCTLLVVAVGILVLDIFIRDTLREVSKELIEECTRKCSCTCMFPSQPKTPRDCQDILAGGNTSTGAYRIFPNGEQTAGFMVRCDMDTDNGGWTVIQRRESKSDFYKTWSEYESGFGHLSSNFWLGNKYIADITGKGKYELRIDMKKANGESRHVIYRDFYIGAVETDYTLHIDGYAGTPGDAMDGLGYHNNRKFTTKDRDNDDYETNCAVSFTGAWWYGDCHQSNLNGAYGNTEYGKGISWHDWADYFTSLTFSEMKIRRKNPI